MYYMQTKNYKAKQPKEIVFQMKSIKIEHNSLGKANKLFKK